MKHIFILFSVIFLLVQVSYSQSCESWLKSYPDLPTESVGVITDNDGNLIVAFNSSTTILAKFDSEGELLWTAPSPNTLTANELFFQNETVYIVAGEDKDFVFKYDLEGNYVSYLSFSSINYIRDVYIGENFIAICQGSHLYKFNLEGEEIFTVDFDFQDEDWEATFLSTVVVDGNVVYYTIVYLDYSDWDYDSYLYKKVGDNSPANIYSKEGVFDDMIFSPPNNLFIYNDKNHFFGSAHEIISINTQGGLLFTDDVYNASILDDLYYDIYRNSTYYSIATDPAGGGGGEYDDYGIMDKSGTSNSITKNIHYVNDVGGITSTETNVFFCGKFSGDLYIDYAHINGSGFFIAKCTEDFALIPTDVDFVGDDQDVSCGSSITLGEPFVNPFVSTHPDYYFNVFSFLWDDESSSTNKTVEVNPTESREYSLQVSAGDCNVIQSVYVDVSKETNFIYSVSGMTLTLEMLSEEIDNFLWDFGDGNSNGMNPNPTYTYSTEGSFSVCLHDVDNSFDCSTCVVLTLPGEYSDTTNTVSLIKNVLNPNIEIYPNPIINSKCVIKLNRKFQGNIDIILIDYLGKAVNKPINYNQTNDIIELSFPEDLKGLYLLNIKLNNQLISHKIIL